MMTEIDPKTGLDTFTWRGQVRYRCPECQFDSHKSVEVTKHWNEVHAPKRHVGGPTLFDGEGKVVDRDLYFSAE